MIVRNMNQPEVQQTLFKAHGGGNAVMLLDHRTMHNILFLAQGDLKPGKEIAAHTDPYEEIYYMLEGEAVMMVGGESQRVKKGDATWIPAGTVHAMVNDGADDCMVLVFAAVP